MIIKSILGKNWVAWKTIIAIKKHLLLNYKTTFAVYEIQNDNVNGEIFYIHLDFYVRVKTILKLNTLTSKQNIFLSLYKNLTVIKSSSVLVFETNFDDININ